MDRIQATPRIRPVIGGLADMLAASSSPERTQQMQGLMQFLQVPDIAQTLDRISYGEPITTGTGMTTSLRPEAKNSLAMLLGFLPIGRAAEPAAVATGRALEPVAGRVAEAAYNRGGLAREMAMAMGQGTQSKIFIGPEARTWSRDAAMRAVNMERQGATPQEIWAATGTARGPDRMWRQEISDDLSMATDPQSWSWGNRQGIATGESAMGPAEEFLTHPQLQAAYPEGLMNFGPQGGSRLVVKVSPEQKSSAGYNPSQELDDWGTLSVGREGAGVNRSSMLHELQHAIQEKERFGVGGNMRDFARMRNDALQQIQGLNDQMTALVRRMDDPATTVATRAELKKQYDALIDQRETLRPTAQIDPYEAYEHLMGEAEARLVQRRLDLTPEQRRQNFPFQFTGETGLGFDVDPARMILMTPEGQITERGLLGSIGR